MDLLLEDHLALASVQGLGSLSQRPLGIFKKVLVISRDLVCFNRTMFRKNLMKAVEMKSRFSTVCALDYAEFENQSEIVDLR